MIFDLLVEFKDAGDQQNEWYAGKGWYFADDPRLVTRTPINLTKTQPGEPFASKREALLALARLIADPVMVMRLVAYCATLEKKNSRRRK